MVCRLLVSTLVLVLGATGFLNMVHAQPVRVAPESSASQPEPPVSGSELDALAAEKQRLEIEELKKKIANMPNWVERNMAWFAPIIGTVIALVAAFVEFRLAKGERLEAEELKREAETARDADRLAGIQTRLLAHADNAVRLEGIRQLATLPPESAQVAVAQLINLLTSDSQEVSDAAATTIIAIGTSRVANELSARVGVGSGLNRYRPLVLLGRTTGSDSYNQLRAFFGSADDRVSGRALGLAATRHRTEFVNELTIATSTGKYARVDDMFDGLLFIEGQDVDALLTEIAVMPGRVAIGSPTPSDYGVQRRAVSLLLDSKRPLDVARLVQVLGDSRLDAEQRAWVAVLLLGSTERPAAEACLHQCVELNADVPIQRIRNLGYSDLARELDLRFCERRGFTPVQQAYTKQRFEEELARVLKERKTSSYFRPSVTTLTSYISNSPDILKEISAYQGLTEMDLVELFLASPNPSDRAEGVRRWVTATGIGSDARWPTVAPTIASLPTSLRPTQLLLPMLNGTDINVRLAAIEVLYGTPGEQNARDVAVELYADGTITAEHLDNILSRRSGALAPRWIGDLDVDPAKLGVTSRLQLGSILVARGRIEQGCNLFFNDLEAGVNTDGYAHGYYAGMLRQLAPVLSQRLGDSCRSTSIDPQETSSVVRLLSGWHCLLFECSH